MYKSLLSRLSAARELLAETLDRERKKAAERKEAAAAAEAKKAA